MKQYKYLGFFFRRNVQNIKKIRILSRSGSLTAAARETGRYKLDLVDVQEVKWDKKAL